MVTVITKKLSHYVAIPQVLTPTHQHKVRYHFIYPINKPLTYLTYEF